jgi:hypothetical protein
MKHLLTLSVPLAFVLACAQGAPSVRLNAEVRNSPAGVTLKNGGTHPYQDVTVKINYGLSGEYSATVAGLAPSDSVTIPYSQFTNSSHERFDYATTAADRVMVRATVNGTQTWEEFK